MHIECSVQCEIRREDFRDNIDLQSVYLHLIMGFKLTGQRKYLTFAQTRKYHYKFKSFY